MALGEEKIIRRERRKNRRNRGDRERSKEMRRDEVTKEYRKEVE